MIFVNVPVSEIVLPFVGIGFLFFHFFESESKKHVRWQSKVVWGRLMYWEGLSVKERLLESKLFTVPEAIMHGL